MLAVYFYGYFAKFLGYHLMKFVSSLRSFLAAAVIASLATSPLIASAQSPTGQVTIRFASFLPESAPQSKAVQAWADELKRRSNGRINFRFFFNSSLVSTADMLPAVSQGRADMAWIGAFIHPRELPLTTITELPFTSTNPLAVQQALRLMYANYAPYRQEMAKAKVHLLWSPITGVNVIGSTKPVNSIADLRGLKVRGGARLLSETFKSQGAQVITMVAPEVYEGMKRGVIDAWTSSLMENMPSFGWHEVSPNVTDPRTGIFGLGLQVMNLDFYNRLSEEDKKLIDSTGDEAIKVALKFHVEEDKNACDKIAAVGGKVTVWSAAAADAWKTGLPDYRAAWIKEKAAMGLPAQELSDRYFEELRKAEKEIAYEPGVEVCAKRFSARK